MGTRATRPHRRQHLQPHSASRADSRQLTRRDLLFGRRQAAVGQACRPLPPAPRDPTPGTHQAAARRITDYTVAERNLVQRVTMGLTVEELERVRQLGIEGYVEYHLDYESIDDSELEAMLAGYTTLSMEVHELLDQPPGGPLAELVFATILRAVYSRRQLFERAVTFWNDHFSIYIQKGATDVLKTVDDREVIRAHALGTFPDLLSASAHSPAMLYYLDNHTSVAGQPNENYARELLELHTLGADNGYSQTDVEEAARCFTGWTLHGYEAGADVGKFTFAPELHDDDFKRVLGEYIPPGGGIQDGEILLELLSAHENTAFRIACKLCHWFWGYHPPRGLVREVTDAYLTTGGDMRAMLRAVFTERWMQRARPKHKRPYHLIVSALRALGGSVTNPYGLVIPLQSTGQIPFFWVPPDGYPDELDFWSGLPLPRWNFGASLLNNELPGVSVDLEVFLAGVQTAEGVIDRIDQRLFGGALPEVDRAGLLAYLEAGVLSWERAAETVGLAVAAPSYQWY